MAKRFDRDLLPDPVAFYESEGLKLQGPGRWKTTRCVFHGGSDSLRINTGDGGWVCMSCHRNGGDVLAYAMQAHGLDFMEAAEWLGALRDGGQPTTPKRNTTLSARAALSLIQHEAWVVACTALSVADAIKDATHRARLIEAVRTIQHVMREQTP